MRCAPYLARVTAELAGSGRCQQDIARSITNPVRQTPVLTLRLPPHTAKPETYQARQMSAGLGRLRTFLSPLFGTASDIPRLQRERLGDPCP
jgi:hypothetical protein